MLGGWSNQGNADMLLRDQAKALIPILGATVNVQSMTLNCGANRDTSREFYLPGWLIHMVIKVLGLESFSQLTFVNWDFPDTKIIPLIPYLREFRMVNCRFGPPIHHYHYPGPQTVTFQGLFEIQQWISKATRTACLSISGLEDWPFDHRLLSNVRCIEVTIDPSDFDADDSSLAGLSSLVDASSDYIGVYVQPACDWLISALVKWVAIQRLRQKQVLRIKVGLGTHKHASTLPGSYAFVDSIHEAVALNGALRVVAVKVFCEEDDEWESSDYSVDMLLQS
ncbi:hypothetical protein FB451DRAFT_1192798 [Mycena latifolia]|nr:hypothetical protein FB451DRAFT_1192798 [Mycena latifolia]